MGNGRRSPGGDGHVKERGCCDETREVTNLEGLHKKTNATKKPPRRDDARLANEIAQMEAPAQCLPILWLTTAAGVDAFHIVLRMFTSKQRRVQV